jgi:hypothetical protein
LKIPKLKILTYKTIQYSLVFLVTLSLPACFQTNLLENKSIPSGKHTVVIMPEQTCADEANGRKLFDEKILQASHKECYYK